MSEIGRDFNEKIIEELTQKYRAKFPNASDQLIRDNVMITLARAYETEMKRRGITHLPSPVEQLKKYLSK
jgi:hypothetical protein